MSAGLSLRGRFTKHQTAGNERIMAASNERRIARSSERNAHRAANNKKSRFLEGGWGATGDRKLLHFLGDLEDLQQAQELCPIRQSS